MAYTRQNIFFPWKKVQHTSCYFNSCISNPEIIPKKKQEKNINKGSDTGH